MSSTKRGDLLEAAIGDLLEIEVAEGRFLFDAKSCRLFRKKGYYSKDRNSKIVFDLSIEVFLPGSTQYSVVFLIECKNYSHAVPVDDIEEFFQKVQQVASANAKAIIFSTASFQSGALAFAESKGIGLARYFSTAHFKWELYRTPSASGHEVQLQDCQVQEALTQDDFVSEVFNLYLRGPQRATNSLRLFIFDVAGAVIPKAMLEKVASRFGSQNEVPFLAKSALEDFASSALASIGHIRGPVSLASICKREKERCGLAVERVQLCEGPALGRITFAPPKIQLFTQLAPNAARERFTLAHELCHHLLDHGRYLQREYCHEADFDLVVERAYPPEIMRMEFQANYLAGCVLMPQREFLVEFASAMEVVEARWRGDGAIYVDHQPCNLHTYHRVVDQLAQRFMVSKSAVNLRLEGLGLLQDAWSKSIRSARSWMLSGLDQLSEAVDVNEMTAA